MADPVSKALSDVRSSVDPALKSVTDAIFGISKGQSEAAASFDASQTQQDIVTGATRTVIATKELGEAAAQHAMLGLSIAASDDGVGIASTQSRLINTFKTIEDSRAKQLIEINKKKAINPLDDFGGWLIAQFTVDDDIQKYNASGQQAEQAANQLQALNTLVDSSWSAQQKVKQTVTVASANAAADAAAAESQKVKETIKREAIVFNANAVKEIASLNGQQLVIRNNAFNAEAQMAQVQNARAHLALAQHAQEFSERMQTAADIRAEAHLVLAQESGKRDEIKLQEFLEDKADKAAAVQDTFNQIKRGMEAAGATQAQLDQVTPQYVRNLVAGRTPQDPKLQQYLRLGNLQLTAATQERIIGLSPSDALTTITTLNPKLSDDAKVTYNRILVQARDDIFTDRSPQVQAILASKDKVQIDRIVNDRANALVAQDAAHVGDPKSIYHLPDVKAISEMVPGIKDTVMWKTFLGNAVEVGADLKDPTVVLALGGQAVAEKKITVNQLADEMAAMYGSAQKINLISKQVLNLGLDAPVSYKVGGSNNKPIDYTKSLDIKKELMMHGYTLFRDIPLFN